MASGRRAKRWPVGGEMLTVKEAAARIGVSEKALRVRMGYYGADMTTVARMYEDGRIGKGKRQGERRMLRGQWTTIGKEAAKLGISKDTLRLWMKYHGATLEEAVAHYEAVRAGMELRRPGPRARTYYVNGRVETIKEAAERVGVSEATLRSYVWHKKCTVQTAVRYYENRRRGDAVREIMGILGY